MKTDKWYKDQPEWGTDGSTKKAKSMTPGQIDEEDYDRKRDRDAERGIPRKKVMSFKTHSNMSPEDKAKRKADYKKAMAASLANIKKQFEETGKDSKGHFRATEKGAGIYKFILYMLTIIFVNNMFITSSCYKYYGTLELP